jgi:hypothetical protein
MTKRGLAILIVTLSTIAAACESGDQRGDPRITAPSPVSPPMRTGQISLRSIRPASGATLSMQDCTYEPETSFDNTQICTGESKIAVDMEFDGDLTASVIAYFYRGSQVCARSERLFQGSRGSVELNIISLTDTARPDEVLTTNANRCPLPIVTTQVVLKVLERSELHLMNPLRLTSQPFAHTYTFDVPSSTRSFQSSFQGLLAKTASSGHRTRRGMSSDATIVSAMSIA